MSCNWVISGTIAFEVCGYRINVPSAIIPHIVTDPLILSPLAGRALDSERDSPEQVVSSGEVIMFDDWSEFFNMSQLDGPVSSRSEWAPDGKAVFPVPHKCIFEPCLFVASPTRSIRNPVFNSPIFLHNVISISFH